MGNSDNDEEDEDRTRKIEADRPKPIARPQEEMHAKVGMVESTVRALNGNPHIRSFNKFRKLCGKIVNNARVQIFVLVLIIVNSIMMGVATFDFVDDDPKVSQAFETADTVFLSIFTAEMCMQIIDKGLFIFRDAWLTFDFVIIAVSWGLDELQVVRAFRIFRAFRVITRVQTMKNLVTAVFDIMPRLGAITGLLLITFYIFAVLFTSLFGDLELSPNPFATLDGSLMILFVFMTMEWADITREVMDVDGMWWAWIPFISFVMITGFIVFNLIIAVVCDAVAVLEDKTNLQPDFFGESSSERSIERRGESSDSPRKGKASEETELIDNLETQMSSALKTQKEMLALLATLESLTQGALSTQLSSPREKSHEGEDEQIRDRNASVSSSAIQRPLEAITEVTELQEGACCHPFLPRNATT